MSEPAQPVGQFVKWLAIATGVFVIAATVYGYIIQDDEAGALQYRLGNQRLEDGKYAEALGEFRTLLGVNPGHVGGLFGEALALMGLGRNLEALDAFERALREKSDFGAVYANRGILQDRLGHHEAALADYRRALALDPELGDGPGWLTRFLRNQYDPPPSIADRAQYLEAELRKPLGERRLRLPEQDAEQRAYKVEGEF